MGQHKHDVTFSNNRPTRASSAGVQLVLPHLLPHNLVHHYRLRLGPRPSPYPLRRQDDARAAGPPLLLLLQKLDLRNAEQDPHRSETRELRANNLWRGHSQVQGQGPGLRGRQG